MLYVVTFVDYDLEGERPFDEVIGVFATLRSAQDAVQETCIDRGLVIDHIDDGVMYACSRPTLSVTFEERSGGAAFQIHRILDVRSR